MYLWLTMAALLLQGVGALTLALRPDVAAATPAVLAALFSANPPHAWIHISWGTLGLLILATHPAALRRQQLGLVFGIFYSLLGFLGVALHDPFGLRLGIVENAIHLTIGPLTLLLVIIAKSEFRAPVSTTIESSVP